MRSDVRIQIIDYKEEDKDFLDNQLQDFMDKLELSLNCEVKGSMTTTIRTRVNK